ncbi:helix-turn-helix domain-containing protein [Christiangramia sediminis]|uniref:AraC family transcriptional regulator n=1 Tax=Christiangramia sediminis TaxID=2881336 RepID=A0A9X1LJJ8_9FLAO|nr:AraC family transcriptional regulator [Christiangramia sediminis]MCB7481494.1 AraC family transcriptional regulator [Christiangramia sediminis]
MSKNHIHIKNVVCQRCIMTVEDILQDLEIPYSGVKLGEAFLDRELNSIERHQLEKRFEKVGFEIIQDRNERLINTIKSVIIEEVYSNDTSNQKLSSILTKELNFDYSHITHLFSESEGQSIQKFYSAVRIERVKELLNYDEWSIAMIADNLGYSTPAYLSTSFKKATGLTPSEYKNMQMKDRKSLDSV